jgi:threonine dehydrogenase-like Zn-dependent dehydrogenase
MYLDPNAVVHKIDRTLAPEIAVMFNPLGAGFRWAVEIPQTGPGDTVVIMGPGQRGLASVLACKEAGADKIIVTGLEADARKMEIAREFGADATIDVQNEDPRARIQELTNGRGADVVVDVSSYATEPIVQAVDFARMGGCIVLAGVKGFKPIPNFISDKVVMKELTIKGAIGVTRSGYASAIRLLEKRRHPVEMMHTHDFRLEEAERAIKTLARQIDGEESIHSCLIPEF